jgi:very-short-patch-repair endonuclease
MHGTPSLFDLLILLGIVVFVVKIVLPGSGKSPVALPYQRNPVLFTPAERSFLAALDQALGDQFRVLGKVRLADVIGVKSGLSGSARQQAFNRIQSKHLDFVVCDPNDLSVQFVVELDDSSHQQSRRQARDTFLDKALAAAGVPIFHFPVKRAYAVQEIREAIFEQSTDARRANLQRRR